MHSLLIALIVTLTLGLGSAAGLTVGWRLGSAHTARCWRARFHAAMNGVEQLNAEIGAQGDRFIVHMRELHRADATPIGGNPPAGHPVATVPSGTRELVSVGGGAR